MASKGGGGGNIKSFYRQKKTGGVSKKPSPPSKSKKPTATHGSNVTQPPALISHGSLDLKDEYDGQEEVLRQFDLNMAYGPCCGMSRLDRWERAERLGLNPPKQIQTVLKQGSNVGMGCLWDGRI